MLRHLNEGIGHEISRSHFNAEWDEVLAFAVNGYLHWKMLNGTIYQISKEVLMPKPGSE